MDAFLKQISDLCDYHKIARSAFVIDDEWEQRESLEPSAWDEFVQTISDNTQLLTALSHALKSDGCDLSSAVPATILNRALALLREQATPEVLTARDKYVQSFHALKHLEKILVELKFEVTPFSSPPDFSKCAIPFLILVDYHLDPEQEGGAHAEKLFADVMRRCRLEPAIPPFVILMSQKLNRDDRDKILKLAERSGFFRFNYEFLPKEDVKRSPEGFWLTLYNFCHHLELSRAYFNQLLKLEEQTKRIATETANRFFQITPAEVSHFRPRMRKEGLDMAEVLTDLFSEHVFAAVSRSGEVRECMNQVDQVLTLDSLPVWDVGEGGPLHHLYSDLLFSPINSNSDAPPQFGDIYLGPGGSYYLVISQECDLAFGNGRPVKARTVLLLPGRLQRRAPVESDGAFASRPFSLGSNKESVWLWWDLMEPRAIRYGELFIPEDDLVYAQKPYSKILRLRTTDAEDIQQQFAAKLTRVGNDVLAGALRMLIAIVEMKPLGTHFKIDICVLSNGKDWDVALLRPSHLLDVPKEFRPNVTFEILVQLGSFNKLKDFKKLLRDVGASVLDRDHEMILGFGSLKHWKGLSEWNGPS